MSPEHVVVVGAGMIGLSTAWYLQEQGVKVTVLDRTGVAAGSSWGNAGWLTPALTLPLSEPSLLLSGPGAIVKPSSPLYIPFSLDPKLIRFLIGFGWNCLPGPWRKAIKVFAQVNPIAMGAFDELSDGGVADRAKLAEPFLAGFRSERDRRTLLNEFEVVKASGGTVDYDLVDGDELRAIEPTLADGVTAGVKLRGQHFINPPHFVNALADAVRARGGEILTGVTVTDVRDTGTGAEVDTESGETHTADSVVIATGAWLGTLARKFGVRSLVQAGRGYSFSVVPEAMPTHPIYFPTQRVACTPLGDRLRVGGMMEFRPADAPLDPRRIRTIMEAAKPMFKGIDWDDRHEEWVGARPCTPDGLPLIGATKSPRVHVGGGHGMWGIALGPLTGRLLAGSILGTPEPVLANFNPLR